MKKEKTQSPLKAARKKAKEDIQKKLANTLQTITNELSKNGVKHTIDIEKVSKKFAKKLVKSIEIPAEPVKGNTVVQTKTSSEEVKPAKVAVKPTASKPVKSAIAKPATKPSAPKAVKPSTTGTELKNGSQKSKAVKSGAQQAGHK